MTAGGVDKRSKQRRSCTHTLARTCARTHAHTHAHTHTHTRTHAYTHTYTRTHALTHTRARTHTHSDTQTHTRAIDPFRLQRQPHTVAGPLLCIIHHVPHVLMTISPPGSQPRTRLLRALHTTPISLPRHYDGPSPPGFLGAKL